MIPLCINGKDYYDREEALAVWFEEWLMKQDFEQDLIDRELELEYRKTHPDWNTPYVMYGVRKKHKCIQKNEIAVFYDLLPRQKRARTAETHWYKVLYKRKATPEEVESLKAGEYTRRYLVYSLFIEKKMTLDKALSLTGLAEGPEREAWGHRGGHHPPDERHRGDLLPGGDPGRRRGG